MKNPGEIILINMTWVNCDIYGGNKLWLLVYAVTGMIWSKLSKNNSDTTRYFLPIINHIQYIHPILFIHCNNYVENKAPEKILIH